MTVTGPSVVYRVRAEQPMQQMAVHPEQFGFQTAPLEALAGGSAEENAQMIRGVLAGEPGPRRDVVLLNAAPAIVAGGAAKTWKEGIQLAKESIDSGAALKKLRELREFS